MFRFCTIKSTELVKTSSDKKLGDRKARLDYAKRLRTNEEQICILMDNILLAIKMNASILPVLIIHDHIGKSVSLPDSWRSKNYAFGFVAAINEVDADDIFAELRAVLFHTLIVDESTDIAVHKVLVLYFKYRSPNSSNIHSAILSVCLSVLTPLTLL